MPRRASGIAGVLAGAAVLVLAAVWAGDSSEWILLRTLITVALLAIAVLTGRAGPAGEPARAQRAWLSLGGRSLRG